MSGRSKKHPGPRPSRRSFTLREHSAIDGLARSDNRQARSPGGERDARAAPAYTRFESPRRRPVLGVGGESEPIGTASGTAAVAFSPPDQAERSIGRATAIMMGGTLLSRATGLLRLLVAAYALGIGPLSDAFNLANNTPNIIHDLVLGGILEATFVPLFVDRLTRRSKREASGSISAVVTLAAVVLAAATALFVLAAPLIIDLYSFGTHNAHIAAERAVGTDLLRLFAVQLLAYGAISLMTALLNAVRSFTLPAYVPVLNNVVAIAVLLEFASLDRHPTLGSVAQHHSLLLLLGVGTTAGVILQAVALIPSTKRAGLGLRLRWAPRDEAVREIVSLSGWTLGFVIANQVALFVSLALAVHIDPTGGAVTAYTYAFIFFQLPFGMVAVSVMNAVTPELAERWSTGDPENMAYHFGLGLRRMLAGILPATAGYLVLAGPIMELLLLHGAAQRAGVHLTGSLLALLALGLPGYCTYLLAIRALQATRDTRSAFFLYLLENGLNVVLLFLLTPSSVLGPQGLALSISIAYSVSAVVALVVARRKMGGLGGRTVGRYVVRALMLSFLMGICVALVAAAIGSTGGVGLLVRVVVAILVGLVVYGGGASLAGLASGWQTAGGRRGAAGKGA